MKYFIFLVKLKNWLKVLFSTSTTKGPFLYFQRVYFLLTASSLLAIVSRKLSQQVRDYLQRKNNFEFIIHNTLGYFSVNAKNDSLTKSITSFEYRHQPWLATSDSKDIFIDIGANIGFYTILSLKKYGYKEAFSFEPNPDTFARLKKNIELNKLEEQVTVCPFGLSDAISTATLATKEVHTGASSFIMLEHRINTIGVEVPIKTFDSFAQEDGLDPTRISFIKIDVEGYESWVLKGMTDTLSKLKIGTCIFIEIHHHSEHAEETRSLLTQANFNCIKKGRQNNFLYQKTV